MACSHPGGREGPACSRLAFLWGTNLRFGWTLLGLYGLLTQLFEQGSVSSNEPRPLGTATNQQAWRSERAELEAGLLVTELLVAERWGLATTHLDSSTPIIEDLGMTPAEFSRFVPIYDCVEFFRFVLNYDRVGWGRCSSRSHTFRHAHTSTDPTRLPRIRLALPLALFLPPRFASSAKLMVGVLPQALRLVGIFLRDCAFRDCRERLVTITILMCPTTRTATDASHMDPESFSSIC